MTIVFKFDRNAVAGALSVMGYGNQPTNVVGAERTASIVIGSPVSKSSLQVAARTIAHEAGERQAAVSAAMARHRTKAAPEQSVRPSGKKVSSGAARVLASGSKDYTH